MRKSMISVFSICFLGGAVAFAGENSSTTNPELLQKPAQVKQASDGNLVTEIVKCRKMTDSFMTKSNMAAEKGKKELSEAYKKCAIAANNMIKSLNTGEQGSIAASNDAMQKAIKDLKKLKGSACRSADRGKKSLDSVMKSCEKRFKYYLKKSEEAKAKGDSDLAAILNKCAQGKREMADALSFIINGQKTCADICNSNKDLNLKSCSAGDKVEGKKKGTCKKDMACYMPGKKREYMTTKAKKLQESAEAISKMAHQAKIDGKTDLADVYSKLATAKQQMAFGYSNLIKGKKEFQTARKELNQLQNSKKVTKTVNPEKSPDTQVGKDSAAKAATDIQEPAAEKNISTDVSETTGVQPKPVGKDITTQTPTAPVDAQETTGIPPVKNVDTEQYLSK